MSRRDARLLPQHAEYLAARGVPLALALEAGLHSVSGAEASELLGRRTPLPSGGLAIPYPDVDPPYARVRLDVPLDGAKFLAPGGREVPVYISTRLVTDPSTPLCIVEGPVKALALAAHGYAAIGLGGTGTTLTNKAGVRQLNDSWSPVQLAERPVVITFDAARNANVNVARDEARLVLPLLRSGASVRVAQLPLGPQGRDQGPDDFIAAHGKEAFEAILARAVPADPVARTREVVTLPQELRSDAIASLLGDLAFLISIIEGGAGALHRVRDLLKTARVSSKDLDAALNGAKRLLRNAAKGGDGVPPLGGVTYAVIDGKTCRIFGSDSDVVAPEPLANFAVKIVQEIVQDDGVEERRRFRLEGEFADGSPFPATQLDPVELTGSEWPLKHGGARAIISPDRDTVSHLRCAIQASSTPEIVRVYQHTGFRKIGDTLAFLHAGGAVGAEGVLTDLEGPLARYHLPHVPNDPRGALELALNFLDVAPRTSTLPLLAAAFRAPTSSLLPPDVCLWAVGQTGSTKSTQVALMMALFGEFDRLNLPATWNDTFAALENRVNRAKDVLFTIDDYAPKSNDAGDETRRKAEQVLRALGNGASRARMSSTMTARPNRPPRGLVVSTGEDRPSGESVTARTIVVKFDRKHVNLSKLGGLDKQRMRLPHAMAAYVAWLLARYESLGAWLRDRFEVRRAEFTGMGGHLRTPEAMAHVALGIELLTSFATDIGVLDNDQGQRFVSDGIEVLRELSAVQGAEVRQVDPVQRFLDVLRLGVMQGRFLLVPPTAELSALPGREAIGWADDTHAFLSPDATYRVVVQDLTRERAAMPLTASSLWERLAERGLLQQGDAGHFTRKVTLGGGRPRVLVMPKWVLESDGPELPPEVSATGIMPSVRDACPAPPTSDTQAWVPPMPTAPLSSQPSGPVVAGASPSAQHRLARTFSDLALVASEIEHAPEVALAVMSGGAAPATRPRLLALKPRDQNSTLVDLHATWGLGPLEDALRRSLVVGHDLVDQLSGLGSQYPVDLLHVWDTMLAERVLNGGVHHEEPAHFDLAPTLERALGVKASLGEALEWSGVLGAAHINHAVQRVEHLSHLRAQQVEAAERADLRRTIDLENDTVPATVGMTLIGIRVDRPKWHALVHTARTEAETLRHEIESELQIENVNSTEQLQAALHNQGTMVEETNKAALAPHLAVPVIGKVTRFRPLSAFVSGPGEGILAALDRSRDDRVRASFKQLGAPTGRFSCSAPNLLGMPKLHPVRGCFVAANGRVFIVADYRTIELRVIAHLTKDPRLLEVLRARGDLHELTARDVLGVARGIAISKDDRKRAKSVNFGFCFGGSAQGFVDFARASYGVAFTLEEAELFRERYLATYTGVREWHKRIETCPSSEVRTIGGRWRVCLGERRFHQMLNTPVQGTGADGAKRALALLHRRLPTVDGRVVLFVHDEFIVEVPEHHADAAAQLVEATMIEGMSHYVSDVPIEVDVSIRTSWSEESIIRAGGTR